MKFLSAMGLATAVLLAGFSAAQSKELKLANFMSPNHPYEKSVFGEFATKVSKATKDAVTVRVFSGGELGPGPLEQYNRAVDGVADIVFSLPGYTASNFPMTLLTELPGVITQENGTAKIQANLKHIKGEYKRVKLVGLWTNATNVIFSREKPIRSIEDIKGLKIRVPSRNAGLIVESWGATPVSMPVPGIYNAMQTGVIDAAMIDGTAVFAFKLGEVTKYITVGMNSSISSFFMVMNRDSYAELTPEQQAAVEKAGKEISFKANEVQLAGAARGLKMFGETEGKEVITLTPEAAAVFNAASTPVIEKVVTAAEAKNSGAKAFIAALTAK